MNWGKKDIRRIRNRAVCIFMSILLTYNLAFMPSISNASGNSGCHSVVIEIPKPRPVVNLVEGEAVVASETYLLARTYLAGLMNYDEENFDAEEYKELFEKTVLAFEINDVISESLEKNASVLQSMEEAGIPDSRGRYRMYTEETLVGKVEERLFTAYAANTSEARQFAEEVARIFDEAKTGEKLSTLAKAYGTDTKQARAMLEQAQACMAADAADADKYYKLMLETKAAISVTGFGVAVIATGGAALAAAEAAAAGAAVTGSAVSIAGIMEAGGFVCSGISAVVDVGNAVTVRLPDGEDSEDAAFFNCLSETYAPLSAVFAIGGMGQAIKDLKDPEKVAEQFANGMNIFATSLGFARDLIQDDVILGVNAEQRKDAYRFLFEEGPKDDYEMAEQIMRDMGLPEEVIDAGLNLMDYGITFDPLSDLERELEDAADLLGRLTVELEGYTDPEEPFDAEGFVETVEEEMIEEIQKDPDLEDIADELISIITEEEKDVEGEEASDPLDWLTAEEEAEEDPLDWLTADDEEAEEDPLDWLTADDEEAEDDPLDWLTADDEEELSDWPAEDEEESSGLPDWLTAEDDDYEDWPADEVNDLPDWLTADDEEDDNDYGYTIRISDATLDVPEEEDPEEKQGFTWGDLFGKLSSTSSDDGDLYDEDLYDVDLYDEEPYDVSPNEEKAVENASKKPWFDFSDDDGEDDSDSDSDSDGNWFDFTDDAYDNVYDDAYDGGFESSFYDEPEDVADDAYADEPDESSDQDEYVMVEVFGTQVPIPAYDSIYTDTFTSNYTDGIEFSLTGVDYDTFLEYAKFFIDLEGWETYLTTTKDLSFTGKYHEGVGAATNLIGVVSPFSQIEIWYMNGQSDCDLKIDFVDRQQWATNDGTSIFSAFNAQL